MGKCTCRRHGSWNRRMGCSIEPNSGLGLFVSLYRVICCKLIFPSNVWLFGLPTSIILLLFAFCLITVLTLWLRWSPHPPCLCSIGRQCHCEDHIDRSWSLNGTNMVTMNIQKPQPVVSDFPSKKCRLWMIRFAGSVSKSLLQMG